MRYPFSVKGNLFGVLVDITNTIFWTALVLHNMPQHHLPSPSCIFYFVVVCSPPCPSHFFILTCACFVTPRLLSITQVPTLVVMNTKTGRPVTHDGLAMLERQWWRWTQHYANISRDDASDDDDKADKEERGDQVLKENHDTQLAADYSMQARNHLLQEWKSGQSGWSTVPWLVHNIVSCSIM